MADFTATFEAGSNGATITTGGGEASATAWNIVTGSPSYDNTHAAHGTLAAKIDASTEYLEWTLPSPTDHYGRMYVYGNFSSGVTYLHNGIDSPATGAYDILLFNNKVYIRDQSATHQFNTTASVPNNAWWRIEWHIICSTTVGQMQLKYFSTPDATSATETLTSSANCNTGIDTQDFRVGGTATVTDTYWIDDIVANATAYPGPVAAAAQTLLASADSVDGSWTNEAGGTTLAGSIDETTASDTDYIQSELSPSASGCRVKLAAGGDPASSSGHEINWRAGKNATGGQTVNMTVKLYQGGGNSLGGGTLIADFDRNAVDAMTDYTETLSGGEADAITDYTDLYLEFHATV